MAPARTPPPPGWRPVAPASTAAPPAWRPAAPAWGPPTHPRRPTSGLAVAALVLGILSLVPLLGILTAIPAIILGAKAIGRTGDHPGAQGGLGLAITGLVLGCVGLLVTLVIVLPAVVFVLVSNIDVAADDVPEVHFFPDDDQARLTVVTVSQGRAPLRYGDLDFGGTCNPTVNGQPPEAVASRQVAAGDILQCAAGQTLTITHAASGAMLYQHHFP